MIQQSDFVKTNTLIKGDVNDSIEMTIDTDSMSHLMIVLSSNLYQNSIGSIIREYTSNAVDANIESKSSDPVIVKLTDQEFIVQDFGPGLDDVDFRNIISKYGKSTKRDKKDQLGYYGLGTKSAFSYTKTFYFICRKNGVERKYLLYKGEYGFNIDLLFEKPTDEKNGVTVVIPVNGNFVSFLKEIKNQLCYFDNVFFDIKGIDLNKDFQIFTESSIQRSTLRTSSEMHICLGRVCYPIDWNILGLQKINLPIGLKFDLSSGIFPTPNRESIIWNDSTKKLVTEKITEVCKDLIKRYNSSVKEVDNLYLALPYTENWERSLNFLGTTFEISCIKHYGNINNVTIKGVKKDAYFYKNRLDFILNEYRLVAELYYKQFKTKRIYKNLTTNSCLTSKVCLLNDNDKIAGHLANFLKSKGYKYYAKRNHLDNILAKDSKYYDAIFTKGYSKEDIDEFVKVKKDFLDNYFIDYTSISQSQEFLDFKKATQIRNKSVYISKKINKQNGQITISQSYKIQGRESYTFKKEAININDLQKSPFLRILIEDDDIFDNSYIKLFSEQKIKFIRVGKLDYKKIKDLKIHNMKKFKDLEQTKAFSRLVTALKINELLESFDLLKEGKLQVVKSCLGKVDSLYKELHSYKLKNYSHVTSDLQKMMLSSAEKNNLWDPLIYDKVKKLEEYIKDFDFITYIRKPSYGESPVQYQNLIYSLMLMKKSKFGIFDNIEMIVK